MLLSPACISNVRRHHPSVTPPYLSRTGRDLLETRGNWLEKNANREAGRLMPGSGLEYWPDLTKHARCKKYRPDRAGNDCFVPSDDSDGGH
jgi:hypothetical protein